MSRSQLLRLSLSLCLVAVSVAELELCHPHADPLSDWFTLPREEAGCTFRTRQTCPAWDECKQVIEMGGKTNYSYITVDGLDTTAHAGIYEFVIRTFESDRSRRHYGGDSYWVRAEGTSVVHGTVVDNWDGTYTVYLPLYDPGSYKVFVRLDYFLCEGTAVCDKNEKRLRNYRVGTRPFHLDVGLRESENSIHRIWQADTGSHFRPAGRWVVPQLVSRLRKGELYKDEWEYIQTVKETAYDGYLIWIPYDPALRPVAIYERLRNKWIHYLGDSITSHMFRVKQLFLLAGFKGEIYCMNGYLRNTVDFRPHQGEVTFVGTYPAYHACPKNGTTVAALNLRSCKKLENEHVIDFKLDQEPTYENFRSEAASYESRRQRCSSHSEFEIIYYPELNLTMSRQWISITSRELKSVENDSLSEVTVPVFEERYEPGLYWYRKPHAVRGHNGDVENFFRHFPPLVKMIHERREVSVGLRREDMPVGTPNPDVIYFNHGLHHFLFQNGDPEAYTAVVGNVIRDILPRFGGKLLIGSLTAPQYRLLPPDRPDPLHPGKYKFGHNAHPRMRCCTPYKVECLNQILEDFVVEVNSMGRERRAKYIDNFTISDPRGSSTHDNLHYRSDNVYVAIIQTVVAALDDF